MKKVLTGIAAVATGFIAGVLVAPKSGKETRKDIKKKVKEFEIEADKTAKKAEAAAKDSAVSIKAGAQKIGDAATETARDIKGNVEKRFN